MLDSGLNLRIFDKQKLQPKIGCIYENTNPRLFKSLCDRIVSIRTYNSLEGNIEDLNKYKTETNNTIFYIDNTRGSADKVITYYRKNRHNRTYIVKGFVPDNSGTQKKSYAFLERSLLDGDVVRLSLEKSPNGGYSILSMSSEKNKSIKDFFIIKKMLLQLDPLVKRFIK